MNRILVVIYQVILWLYALYAIPKMVYQLIFRKKYRKSFLSRWGFNTPEFSDQKPVIWLHAVSVGETKAMVPLAREIKKTFPQAQLVISSVTETGYAEAQRSLPFADHHMYLPLDFRSIVKRIVSKAQPDLVILCESDFWFNFLYQAKKGGAAIALVNGKLSERSMRHFSQVPFFSKRLFNLCDVACVQNTLYEKRFIQAGVPPERIVITGNLKLDEEYPHLSKEEIGQWKQKLGIEPHQLVLTIGSTHHPEEEIFFNILKGIWQKIPHLKVIIVPRHPERFREVETLLEREQIAAVNFTGISHRTGKEQVILIDAMGVLRMCYQLSDVALVGGSFTSRVGGHNILEPCWYGKPVLFGPFMHTQVELVDLVKQYDVGQQVTQQELPHVLEKWLTDPSERARIGHNGQKLLRDLKGSTQRTLDAMAPIFPRSGCAKSY